MSKRGALTWQCPDRPKLPPLPARPEDEESPKQGSAQSCAGCPSSRLASNTCHWGFCEDRRRCPCSRSWENAASEDRRGRDDQFKRNRERKGKGGHLTGWIARAKFRRGSLVHQSHFNCNARLRFPLPSRLKWAQVVHPKFDLGRDFASPSASAEKMQSFRIQVHLRGFCIRSPRLLQHHSIEILVTSAHLFSILCTKPKRLLPPRKAQTIPTEPALPDDLDASS